MRVIGDDGVPAWEKLRVNSPDGVGEKCTDKNDKKDEHNSLKKDIREILAGEWPGGDVVCMDVDFGEAVRFGKGGRFVTARRFTHSLKRTGFEVEGEFETRVISEDEYLRLRMVVEKEERQALGQPVLGGLI